MNQRELNTVLAALRFWQWQRVEDLPHGRSEDILDIESNYGADEPLTDAEIDALCERINIQAEAGGCDPHYPA